MTKDDRIITSNLESHFKALKETKATRFSNAKEGAQLGTGPELNSQELKDLSRRFKRREAMSCGTGAISGGGQISSAAPKIQSPFYQRTNLALPLDRITRNQWCRFYYRHEPYVKSAIDLHSQFPISEFENTCSDSKIKEFFDDMVFNQLDIVTLLLEIGIEFWKLGDVFPMGNLDRSSGTWNKFILLNPDYVDIQTNIFAQDPLVTLVPDDDLKAIVGTGPYGPMGELFKQLSPQVVAAIKRGENIPLSPLVVSQLSNKASSYEVWGTPLIQNVFKVLLYKDRLREAQQAIADRFITPLRIFKVGNPSDPQPSQEELNDLKDLLEQLEDDPAPVLVYHSQLDVTGTDFASRLLSLAGEFQFIKEELLVGLSISEAVLTGESSTYGSAETAIEVLRRRYLRYRSILTTWIEKKVYAPIAELQEFYQPEPRELVGRFRSKKKEEKRLLYPRVTWHGKDMIDEDSARQLYLELQNRGLISLKTMLPKFGLNFYEEMRNIKLEQHQMETGDFKEQDSVAGGNMGGKAPPPLPTGDIGGPSDLDITLPDAGERPVDPEVGSAPPPGNETTPAFNKNKKVFSSTRYSPGVNKYSPHNPHLKAPKKKN